MPAAAVAAARSRKAGARAASHEALAGSSAALAAARPCQAAEVEAASAGNAPPSAWRVAVRCWLASIWRASTAEIWPDREADVARAASPGEDAADLLGGAAVLAGVAGRWRSGASGAVGWKSAAAAT
eukprot:scaffold41239_cov60-Phaeocystis_antarctica.AAC.2